MARQSCHRRYHDEARRRRSHRPEGASMRLRLGRCLRSIEVRYRSSASTPAAAAIHRRGSHSAVTTHGRWPSANPLCECFSTRTDVPRFKFRCILIYELCFIAAASAGPLSPRCGEPADCGDAPRLSDLGSVPAPPARHIAAAIRPNIPATAACSTAQSDRRRRSGPHRPPIWRVAPIRPAREFDPANRFRPTWPGHTADG